MATSTKYAGSVKVVGRGTIELVQTTMQFNEKDRARVARDPRKYFQQFLKAQRLATNEFIANDLSLEKLAKAARTGKTAYLTVHAHVISPKRYRSRRIIVISK